LARLIGTSQRTDDLVDFLGTSGIHGNAPQRASACLPPVLRYLPQGHIRVLFEGRCRSEIATPQRTANQGGFAQPQDDYERLLV
jgi:hypothetical protein